MRRRKREEPRILRLNKETEELLERFPPGEILERLLPFVHGDRPEGMRQVLGGRTRHLTALIEHVHDPHNVAACMRSCDAFGIQDLHIVTQDFAPIKIVDGITKRTHRWLTLYHHQDLSTALQYLRNEGYRVLATDPGDAERIAEPLEEVSTDIRLCVAFGNEHSGISAELRAQADGLMVIPMKGFVESFNISVAFAVSFHHLREKLDRSREVAGDLSLDEQTAILDRWVLEDVREGPKVLRELIRREGLAL